MEKHKYSLENKWNDADASGKKEEELLLYRSNLLGSDLRITNFGGGNTSAKITMKDTLTNQNVQVLWVKGSGGDIGTMKLSGFATLYMDKLNALKSLYKGKEHEDEMVGYLPHCTFNLNTTAASIDTPLHAYIPYPHVDHMHADTLIAIAASEDGKKITKEIFKDEVGWIDWQRPGFDLGLKLEQFCKENPKALGVILGGHGFFSWGSTSKACYEQTLSIIQRAADYLQEKSSVPAFGGEKTTSLSEEKRRAVVSELMPHLRSRLCKENLKIAHYNDSKEILEFVNSKEFKRLADLGTSCPDHFLRTKIKPLVIELADGDVAKAISGLDALIEDYRTHYEAYYNRNKEKNSPAIRDPYPVIILIPQVGMISFAKDKATARIAGEFYVNAINVMRESERVSKYVALSEKEAFDIEYWLLEEAKLQRMPKPKMLAGRVALVTGGAGGIGKATAHRFLAEGAHVVLSDIDEQPLAEAVSELASVFGKDVVRGSKSDVTKEEEVIQSLAFTCREFGGIDILVCNAGIASSAFYEDTTLDLWNKNISVLQTGYFLVSREAYKVMRTQKLGGSVIFVSSKNGLQASPQAAAYCVAKSAEIHLARCLAAESAGEGIRVNIVNPDAVIRGSRIWSSSWKAERAKAYKIKEDELEDFYKNRSMLKRNVFPEDIAEAIYFFASDHSNKSTGNILNVDAGNLGSFPR